MKIISFLVLFLVTFSIFAQNNRLIIQGDSLTGKNLEGNQIREVYGNVVITQGNVRITCNKAIQSIDNNEAELIGNVVLTQDSTVIITERGYYYGKTKTAYSDRNVTLNKGNLTLIAEKGYYYFDERKSDFYQNVNLYQGNTKLYSQRLIFFQVNDKAVAWDNVIISDTSSVIFADSLIHFLKTDETYGYKNIKLKSYSDNIEIFGEELYYNPDNDYISLNNDCLLVQTDTSEDGSMDTLYIKSEKMESSKNGDSNFLIAYDSVKIFKSDFASVNEITFYNRKSEEIRTYLLNETDSQPIIWYEDSQITGDSIYVKTFEKKISMLKVFNKSMVISESDANNYRYNQISGDTLIMNFENGKISETNVNGNVLSIYYIKDDGKPNGLLKSSAKYSKVDFNENRIKLIKMYGSPKGEYHPEKLISGNEKDFFLPLFMLHENKPQIEEFQIYSAAINE